MSLVPESEKSGISDSFPKFEEEEWKPDGNKAPVTMSPIRSPRYRRRPFAAIENENRNGTPTE